MKDFLTKVFFPLALASLALLIAFQITKEDASRIDYVWVWFVAGIPYGIRKMRVWIISRSGDMTYNVGTFILFNIVPGMIIGGFVLAWRIIYVVFYLIKIVVGLFVGRRVPTPIEQ